MGKNWKDGDCINLEKGSRKKKNFFDFLQIKYYYYYLTHQYLNTPIKMMNEFIMLRKILSVREGGENECRGSKLKKVNPSKMR